MIQSGWVRDRLAAAWPELRFQIVKIDTRGDTVLDRPLPEIGGKGLFTEALEAALLSGGVDMAVHSLKDLPTDPADGLAVGAVCEREDPRDAWVTRADGPPSLDAARRASRVGTSSLRRQAQLLAVRPDLQVASIRGNVETRIRKLDDGEYDALVMAAAGLRRLGLSDRVTSYLDAPDWLPAPGQGAIAVESREDDDRVDEILRPIDDHTARAETEAERALLATLQGGCQVPVGALARSTGVELALHALVAMADGTRMLRARGSGPIDRPAELGQRVARDLLSRGGAEIVASFRELAR